MRIGDQRLYVKSIDLAVMENMDWLLAVGYYWIRPVVRPWKASLRNPTVGRVLEATAYPDVDSVALGTREAKRLIRGLSVRG
jgi:hypothetical protein